ncbi:MAG: TIGR02266 family protein [Myxococcales bacterium]|nr:TIGR02266 family protein [Myxococcales bacterium]
MSNERRHDERVFVNLVLKVKYPTQDEFADHFATNISAGGVFLQSRDPKPKGTLLRFEIQLSSGQTVLKGSGVVAWARAPSVAGQPLQVPGMGVKFLDLDEPSRALVRRILERKGATSAATPRPPAPPATPPRPPIRPAPPEVDVDIDVEPSDGPPKFEVAPELAAVAEKGPPAGEIDIPVMDLSEPDPGARRLTLRPTGGETGSKVIGIDLGTTYSCAAVVKDGMPQVIPSRKGYRTMPSIVAYDERGRLLVGYDAKAQMELNPRNTVYGSKRLIGRPFDSPAVQQMKDRFQYEIIEGPKREAAVRIVGREFSLQQVAAFVLSEIRDEARAFLGEEVSRAVITVPAYYNENQRQAVREAGTLAGFKVERIVNEPTAAALAFGFNRGLDQRVMVYDLGGGTFDASVLELCGNVYGVVATGGDIFLGGVDFDNQLVDYILAEYIQQLGTVPKLDRVAMQRLRDAAEQAKCALSEKQETIVRLPGFAKVNRVPRDLEVRISRETLEELVGPLVERTLKVAQGVLSQARMSTTHLDNIVLVGGQSRMPLVWRRIHETFGKQPHKGVHPDEAVAVGAALLADSLDKLDSVVLIDVLPMSIGIGLPGGKFAKILQAGTALPTNRICMFRTFTDRQTSQELLVFQGEAERVVDCEYLGTLVISNITPAPRGTVQLEVNFALDQECLLKVTCREPASGRVNETRMAARDSDDSIRRKLQIPAEWIPSERIGVPESLRAEKKAGLREDG